MTQVLKRCLKLFLSLLNVSHGISLYPDLLVKSRNTSGPCLTIPATSSPTLPSSSCAPTPRPPTGCRTSSPLMSTQQSSLLSSTRLQRITGKKDDSKFFFKEQYQIAAAATGLLEVRFRQLCIKPWTSY
jgi:hypothetical protein